MKKNNHLLQALNTFSAKVAQNPALVQGAGGNTSIKLDSTLYVKASGKWLANALSENIFTAINLPLLLDDIAHHKTICPENYVVGDSALKPSIEMTLHALLPHQIIFHLHSINTLAWAVKKNVANALQKPLQDLPWVLVPYVKPGVELAHACVEAFKRNPAAKIFILQNHGLIVGADTFEEVIQLIEQVETRLALPARPCNHPVIQSLAFDPVSFKLLEKGVLYPDQAVFLGASVVTSTQTTAHYSVIENTGVFIKPNSPKTLEEALLAHALLLLKLNLDDDINSLNPAAIAELMNWDAEIYRQELNKK